MNTIPEQISRRFKFWSFFTILTVVLSHSYNLNIRYLQPFTTPNEALTITTFAEYIFANGLFRFTMPLLFAISGYLYAMKDEVPNNIRIKKRVKALLIPFLIWSAVGIIMVYLLEMIPTTKLLISTTHIAMMNEAKPLLHNYQWYDFIIRWLLAPISYQLWFIQVLFFYNIGYPSIKKCVLHKTGKWIFFGIAIFMWLFTLNVFIIEGEGLLFFSLGVWLQKTNFDIQKPKRWLNPMWWGILFLLLNIIKSFLAFRVLNIHDNMLYPIINFMMKFSVFAGLVFAWYSSRSIALYIADRKWFINASIYTFFIYAAHAPLVAIGIDVVLNFLYPMIGYRLGAFILWPAMLILGLMLIGFIIKKVFPSFFRIITGGRGF